MLGAIRIGIWVADGFQIAARSAGSKPVVPTTRGIPRVRAALASIRAAAVRQREVDHDVDRRDPAGSDEQSETPERRHPARRPASSTELRDGPLAPGAAPSFSAGSSAINWINRVPIRPVAPWMPIERIVSGHGRCVPLFKLPAVRLGFRVQGDRPDDVVEVVGDDDRPVGETRSPDAPAAQHLVELSLVGAVIGDGGRRVLELVAGQDADDAVRRGDHALLAQPPGPGHAGRAGRLAAQSARSHPRLRIHDLLVADHRAPPRCRNPAPAGISSD